MSLRRSTGNATDWQFLAKPGETPINSGSLPTSRQTPKSYARHTVVIG
jgi:hypothetical protein